jgi:hypothetical protein
MAAAWRMASRRMQANGGECGRFNAKPADFAGATPAAMARAAMEVDGAAPAMP